MQIEDVLRLPPKWRFNAVSIEWPGKLNASLKWLTLTTRACVAFLYIEWKSNRWHTWNITTVQCVCTDNFLFCAPWKMPFTSAGNKIAPENGKTARVCFTISSIWVKMPKFLHIFLLLYRWVTASALHYVQFIHLSRCICSYGLVNVSIKNINILSRIIRALVIFLLTQG